MNPNSFFGFFLKKSRPFETFITCNSMKILQKKKMYISSRKKCTLLIPEYLFPYFESMKNHHGDLKSLFRFLLGKYFKNKARYYRENDISTTVSYQEDGLELHRENFFPIEWDWVEMKLIANSHNMS